MTIFVGHKFEMPDENYLWLDGDILLHQYTCKHLIDNINKYE